MRTARGWSFAQPRWSTPRRWAAAGWSKSSTRRHRAAEERKNRAACAERGAPRDGARSSIAAYLAAHAARVPGAQAWPFVLARLLRVLHGFVPAKVARASRCVSPASLE